MSRPLIGISAAVEPASFGPWVDEPAVLLPHSYARTIQATGGIAVLVAPDPRAEETAEDLLGRLDGVVLGGGTDIGDNPQRDEFEIALARRALDGGLPLLGVCRGMQVMNVARGGTLENHLPDRLGHEAHRPIPGSWAEHDIRLEPGSLAAEAAGGEELSVKSHHHQGVDELGEGFTATGWADDGETIEAIEGERPGFALGVLWHPEEEPEGRVIPTFVEAAS